MEDLNDVYFLKNKDWYYYDKEAHKMRLTDKAPKKAIESYEEYYAIDTAPDGQEKGGD